MRLLVALSLAAAVIASYLPVLDAQFLEWDDNIYVSRNPFVHGFSWRNLTWAFTTFHTGNWIPLTWLSHALDVELYGLDPAGHHATGLAFHVVNTVLLFLVFERMTGALWQCAVVAALFGLHPLHVESVAWVSERKDVLSTFFWLLAIAAYARYARAPTVRSFLPVAATFLAALLAKPMVVTLPLILLLLDYWPLRRLGWAAVREKLPLVAIALACAIGAFVAQRTAGAMEAGTLVPPAARVTNAVVAYVRYLGLAVWPQRLSPWYSHPALEGSPLTWPVVTAASIALVTATTVALVCACRRPHVAVGWFWYLLTLLPAIGLVQVGGQAMADRYTYVPLIGIFLIVVWEAAALPLWRRPARAIGIGVTTAVLIALGVLTRQQTRIWHDSTTFWAYTLEVNPRAAVAYYALGGMLSAKGRVDEAIAAYRRSLKLRPDYVNAHTEVANLLVSKGRLAAAAAHYRKAIAGGQQAEGHNNLGNVLLRLDNPDAARRHLEIAIGLRPNFVEAHNNLGIVLANQGHLEEAAAQFRTVLAARPDFAAARRNLEVILAEQQKEKEEGAESGS